MVDQLIHGLDTTRCAACFDSTSCRGLKCQELRRREGAIPRTAAPSVEGRGSPNGRATREGCEEREGVEILSCDIRMLVDSVGAQQPVQHEALMMGCEVESKGEAFAETVCGDVVESYSGSSSSCSSGRCSSSYCRRCCCGGGGGGGSWTAKWKRPYKTQSKGVPHDGASNKEHSFT